ncbi:Hint domain-containing protein [Roseovarius sp. SCSIO 43702]|uniref:Hint domain-containing protein n=1 Tax=Roseovarius sp. SCSIO 43702 TaxID=2823043 RepID=UPI001C73DFE2|nr:Hint domain-containing protein [Roseovarius sp. SCSIO 43702]QYX57860.1 Hint domain-containing protein [Roseovarius sp. SCSIO 43702]
MVYTPSATGLDRVARSGGGFADPAPLTPRNAVRMGLGRRVYEMSWLRRDGAVETARQSAPNLPLFQSAFSAFARGTLIATSSGPVAVEDLTPGMRLLTEERGPSPLLWVGSMTLLPDETRDDAPLTRIMADAFGIGRPMPDLLAGPGARLMQRLSGATENLLRPVQSFRDGTSVIALRPPSPVRLYHVLLHRHATINVGGLIAETFHPGPGFEATLSYEMRAQFMALFPHLRRPADFGSLVHPRQTRDAAHA